MKDLEEIHGIQITLIIGATIKFSDIENFLDDLTSVRAENVEYCLQHARQLLKQTTDLAVELVNLESGKDSLVQSGILDEQQAIDISQRLEASQEKCTLLSIRVLKPSLLKLFCILRLNPL